MHQIDRTIVNSQFDGLKVKKLWVNGTCETLLITLEKGSVFPEHTSPRDALLIMMEGRIRFHIADRDYVLQKQESLSFGAEERHKVTALEDAKFLIIR